MNIKKLICEDSIDGIFTGVYEAWIRKNHGELVKLSTDEEGNFELFTDYINITTDYLKSSKVANTIKRRLGDECYIHVCQAALSCSSIKADAIFRLLLLGLSTNMGFQIMNALGKKEVATIFELSRNVGNEAHHYLGFVRFKELHNGVLFSEIDPKNNVLTLMAPHFADRLSQENWMIYDRKRQLFIVHQKAKSWVLVTGESLNIDELQNTSAEEIKFQELWKEFCHNISIKERENKKLQKQNLPLRFQQDMVEFSIE